MIPTRTMDNHVQPIFISNHEYSYIYIGKSVTIVSLYTNDQNKEILKEVLSESVGKIKEYLAFKERLDEEGRQSAMSQPYISLQDVRKAIRSRESKITHFIETLTVHQITLLYLLFQAGSDIQAGIVEESDDIYKKLFQYIDSDFNFSHTNNRQFKLSYFHDYLFTRRDATRNVTVALKGVGK